MNKGSTLFLKTAIMVFGLFVFILSVFVFPHVYGGIAEAWSGISTVEPLAFIGLYLSAIPFFIALYQGFKLLTFIDTNTAFSEKSIHSLKVIKYAAASMTFCYILVLPLVYSINEHIDPPGIPGIALGFTCLPLVIATFAAVLQKLVHNAVDIKSENELTV